MLGKALVVLLSFAAVEGAHAQTPEERAREVFEKGLAAEAAGDRAQACEHFRRSLSLLRELGPLRKSTDCDIADGRLITARDALDELISRWPRAGAELDALKNERTSVDGKIPRLTLELRAGATVTARVDGKSVEVPSTTELDPGEHEVVIDQAGRPLSRLSVRLGDGERKALMVPEAVTPTPEIPDPGGLSGLLIGGIVGLSVGGLGLVGAGITGGLVLAKDAEHESCLASAEAACGALADEGNTLLTANTALWIAGLVASGVGATLLIVEAASGPSVEVGLGPGRASMSLRF